MPLFDLFKKQSPSKKVLAGGPSPEDQMAAIIKDKYWTVLNSHLLAACKGDDKLTDRANAFKHALQTYGPISNDLPCLIMNEGKAKNHVFHGHVTDNNGTAFVLEWTVIDADKRWLALLGFKKHENYAFAQGPLTALEKSSIIEQKRNQNVIAYAALTIEHAKNKAERTMSNYGFE